MAHHELEIENVVAKIIKRWIPGEVKKDGHKEEQKKPVRDTKE
jgi:hypothetical protein